MSDTPSNALDPHGAGGTQEVPNPPVDPVNLITNESTPPDRDANTDHTARSAPENEGHTEAPQTTGRAAPDPNSTVSNDSPGHVSAGTGESQSEASGHEAVARASTGEEEPPPPRQPTNGELITVCLIHAILVAAAIYGTLAALMALDGTLNTSFNTVWEQPKGVRLRSGPSAFRYNPGTKQLVHRGPIDDKEKSLLVALADPQDESYERAVDALAFESFAGTRMVLTYTLMLGGLGGLVGVLLRNISNFLGVACFKRNFYFPVWWPWYFLRPFLAFLTGMVLVILVKSDLLTSPQSTAQGGLWFVGLAVLAGFGVDDFLGRLRVLSKTVFPPEEAKATAEAKVKSPTEKKPGDRPPTPSGGGAGGPGANRVPARPAGTDGRPAGTDR